MSAKEAKREYGVDNHASNILQVRKEIAKANDINEITMALASL